MGLGNGNPNYGNKGSNFNYELRHLQMLANLITAVAPPAGGLATEATAISILNAIISSAQDIEILLVRDTGNSDEVVQQITDYSGGGAPVVTYKDVNGGAYIPVGPLEYLDPSAVLNLILAQNTAINNKIVTNTEDGAIATDQILPTNISVLYAEGDGADVRLKTDYGVDNRLLVSAILTGALPLPTGAATEVTLAALNAKLNSLGQKASAASAPVVLSTEQEAILATIDAVLDTIKTDTGLINTNVLAGNAILTTIDAVLDNILLDTAAIQTAVEGINTKLTAVVRTPNMLRVTAAGAASIAAGSRSACIWNYGNVNATVLGQTLARGEKVCWSADGEEDTLGAISYNADTSSLLITWTI